MKTICRSLILFGCMLIASNQGYAQKKASRPTVQKYKDAKPKMSAHEKNLVILADVLELVRQGNYLKAAPLLFNLSRKADFAADRMQIKYILGTCLLELDLYQTAAFQFVDVIRHGDNKYVKQAIEKLSMAADRLGDDTLLNYAVSKVKLDDFPVENRDIVYYRLAEIKDKSGNHVEAADLFGRVPNSSRYFVNSRFQRALALNESGKAKEGLEIFQALLRAKENAPVTDPTRVSLELAVGRSYYQLQDFDSALAMYQQVPKDSEFWHDALFESSWAYLRAAKFRSTLSQLQSLHSAFYDDYYMPESMIIRSIVYLYICKFEETTKTLDLYDRTYLPIKNSITRFLNTTVDPNATYAEVEKYYSEKSGTHLQRMISRNLLEEGDVRRAFDYLKTLAKEKDKLVSLPAISQSPLGAYTTKVLANRYRNTKISIGEKVRAHLMAMQTELVDFSEQVSFIRYETINGQKELLKKKIAGTTPPTQVDDGISRVFYVQNGYEYWPFEGEYWLDELGNYHYLGKQSCE